MIYLLDVNVLTALADPSHVQHEAAHGWFGSGGSSSFATCPLTENGLLRIVGNPRYPNSPGTPAAATGILAALRAMPGDHFWPDDVSAMDARCIDTARLLSQGQVKDSYLLALAVAHGGKLATLDRRLATDAVVQGAGAAHVI